MFRQNNLCNSRKFFFLLLFFYSSLFASYTSIYNVSNPNFFILIEDNKYKVHTKQKIISDYKIKDGFKLFIPNFVVEYNLGLLRFNSIGYISGYLSMNKNKNAFDNIDKNNIKYYLTDYDESNQRQLDFLLKHKTIPYENVKSIAIQGFNIPKEINKNLNRWLYFTFEKQDDKNNKLKDLIYSYSMVFDKKSVDSFVKNNLEVINSSKGGKLDYIHTYLGSLEQLSNNDSSIYKKIKAKKTAEIEAKKLKVKIAKKLAKKKKLAQIEAKRLEIKKAKKLAKVEAKRLEIEKAKKLAEEIASTVSRKLTEMEFKRLETEKVRKSEELKAKNLEIEKAKKLAEIKSKELEIEKAKKLDLRRFLHMKEFGYIHKNIKNTNIVLNTSIQNFQNFVNNINVPNSYFDYIKNYKKNLIQTNQIIDLSNNIKNELDTISEDLLKQDDKCNDFDLNYNVECLDNKIYFNNYTYYSIKKGKIPSDELILGYGDGKIFNDVGKYYFEIGEYETSEDYFLKSYMIIPNKYKDIPTYNLGVLYATLNTKKSNIESMKYFKETKFSETYFNIAVSYYLGLGVEKNNKLAYEYFLKASNKDLARAKHNISRMPDF